MIFVPLKVNRRRDRVSHVFTGEDSSTIKEYKKGLIRVDRSHVVFNDYYFERNPKINPTKCARYEFENKYKKNVKYSDEFHICERRKKLLKRK